MAEPKAVGQVFNIGNGEEISMRDLAEKVKAMTGSASEIVPIPYEQAYEAGFEDMPRRVPDISKIRGLVGYEPKVELDEILTRVIDYIRTGRHSRGPRHVSRMSARSDGGPGRCRGRAAQAGEAVRKVLLALGARATRRRSEIVQIESTNICNAKCVFCPRDEMDRNQGVMDMALFKKVADECAALDITHMRMHNYGEAFADRSWSRRSATPSRSASARSA